MASRIRRAGVVLIAAVALLALSGSPSAGAPSPKSRPVKVMTRNLYLGADLTPAIAAASIPQVLAAGAQIFSTVQRTSFPERAVALAREIADADPTLLGLQEVATWYSGPFNDPAPATTVEYDFLQILLAELAAAGAAYDVVVVQPEADIEGPAGAPFFKDFRLVQNDAILVKAGLGDAVSLRDPRSANFTSTLVLTTGTGQTIPVKRGWTSVEATVNKRSFRFVNTHLEAFHPLIRLQQAQELIAPTGPIGSAPGDVVLVGDLNSGPELPVPANRLAYQALVAAGLVDTWLALHPGDPGFTSGYDELLLDPPGTLEHRVDHVMVKGSVGIIRSRIYGTDPANRTPSGMWPSDHAGVLATVTP
jgi:endonuclease/exonuclease/phosphatase family metal-dependent hydrolase